MSNDGDPPLQPQLAVLVREFEQASERLRRLAWDLDASQWAHRPAESRWSVAECVAHVNLASSAYLPLLRDGIDRARRLGTRRRRYHRDIVGWLLWRGAGPPVRTRVRTTAAFVPSGAMEKTAILTDFGRLQNEQIACVRDANGLPIDRVTLVSPFSARIKYSLYSAMTILPRHQHRHLWQAEQVAESLRTGRINA
jgi:hypothetical protein